MRIATTRLSAAARVAPYLAILTFMACVDGHPLDSTLANTPTDSVPSVAVQLFIAPSPVVIGTGTSQQLSVTAKFANGHSQQNAPAAWWSARPSVAQITDGGLVTGLVVGVDTVVATMGTVSTACIVTVVQGSPVVASITIVPANASVAVGGTVPLTATARDASGNVITGATISWASAHTTIAAVSTSGIVTGIGAGTDSITASSGGVTAAAAVTVSPAAAVIASVSVSPATGSLAIGATATLTATAKDAGGNPIPGVTFTWSSAQPTLATVSTAGVVSGVAVGTDSVRATAGGHSGVAVFTITPAPVASVVVSPSTATVAVGATAQLQATAKDAYGNVVSNATITWSSAHTGVATVSAAGAVSGVSAGSDSVIATANGHSGAATITVTPPAPPTVASVTIAPSTTTVTVGATTTLTATAKDASGNTIAGATFTWSSAHPSLATVSSAGVVTGVAVGADSITASANGVTGHAVVTVQPPPVASIVVAPATVSIVTGGSTQLTATALSAGGQTITGVTFTWTSAHPSLASVSTGGLVTGAAVGTDSVIASANGVHGASVVTITAPPVTSVAVTPATTSVNVGASTQLTATAKDSIGNAVTGAPITWSSAHTTLATVSATGLVTGVAAGVDTISATSNGKVGLSVVTVTAVAPVVASMSVSPTTASIGVGKTQQLTATAKSANGTVLAVTVAWSSAHPSIATVSNGLVTGVAVGSDSITVSSGGFSATALITVTAPAVGPVATVTLTPGTSTVAVSGTQQYTAVAKDANGTVVTNPTLTWTSKHTATATVSATGMATGVAAGSDTITATSNGKSGIAALTVASASMTFAINTSSTHAISRYIYGMNYLTDGAANGNPWGGATTPTGVTLSRFGGDRITEWNWENNYSNAGADYLYENDTYLDASQAPGDAAGFRYRLAAARNAGLLIGIPMIGYVAGDANGTMDDKDSDRATRLATRFKVSHPTKGAPFTLTPSTTDADVYQDEFVNWVNTTFPGAVSSSTAPIMFELDNEPDDWTTTHQEVQSNYNDNANTPRYQTYTGYIDTTILYAAGIKAVTPSALVFGPAMATYTGIVDLGQYPTSDPVYGSQNFTDVYLKQLAAAGSTYGKRLVDVFDFHWYPAAGVGAYGIINDFATQNAAMINARVQAPRSLWDPSYNEGSWVNQVTGGPIYLIPRFQAQIAADYPGTKLAMTEYYYGRAGDISGGVAQADVLGIFGKYGMFAATLWPQANVWASPYNGSGTLAWAYAFGAFDNFVNYDGAGSRFGDTGLAASTSDSVNSSVYASLDAQGRVVAVAINKEQTGPVTTLITIASSTNYSTATAYVMSDGHPTPVAQAPVTVSGNALYYTMPALSVSTIVFTPGTSQTQSRRIVRAGAARSH